MKIISDFIIITGIVIVSLILLLLIKKHKKELPQYILIVIFSFVFVEFINAYVFLHEIYLVKTFSIIFSSSITWVLGPLFFLYIKSLFTNENKFIKKNFVHFIPYVVYIYLKSIIYVVYSHFDKDNITYAEIFDKKWVADLLISNLYLAIYILLSLIMLNKYKKVIKLNFSNISEHDFNWIKIMLIGYLFTISIDIFFSLVTAYSLYDFYATMIIMTIVTIYLGYYGVNQSRILLPDFLVHEVTCNEGITLYEDLTKKNIKHQLSYSSDQEIEDLKLRLENVLRIDMPYLDENLTLKKLADMIPTSDKKLSTLLNQFMNISFYDLINKYRVEAIKGKMISEDNKKYTLLGLAYDCGFSSKSSFIRIFKKETGIPPSEYKKQLES